MARQVKARRVNRNPQVTAHTLWLAGLGAVSMARRQVAGALVSAKAGAVDFRHRAVAVVGHVVGAVNAQVSMVTGEASARLSPLMARFGLLRPVARKAKPASRRQRPRTAKAGRKAA